MSVSAKIGWVMLLAMLATPMTAWAEESAAPAKAPKLVLLDLEAAGAPVAEVQTLGESLCTELGQVRGYELVCASELKVMLEHMSLQRLTGCSSEQCLREISGSLQADWLMLGSVGKVGETYTLNLRLMNAATASVASRVTRTVPQDLAKLLGELKPALGELFKGLPSTTPIQGAR